MTDERLYTAAEVGELLGFRTSTILDWHEAGKLAGVKVGRAVRFPRSALDQWLGPDPDAPVSTDPPAVGPSHCHECRREEETRRFYAALLRRHGVKV